MAMLTKRAVVNGSVANIDIQPCDDQLHVHAIQHHRLQQSLVVPRRPPEPMTRRRMLRHNAIEVLDKMLKTGWRRCRPPVR
ncbi:DUF1651 domain-containing protein [Synechococcus sp. PROS-U-1]|uniref:DUF1651 domain-containing protein n=1 Tax=Synechococcus sp. PROS-U-1 TaxID=1400866 RepID=UPI001644258B|nr:DUF1651 domain-containing protein [Synechococcus sp. PROS-U-1]QNJ03898.1 hypothetical protein SynPROSU1_02304 [Synechococcus sp. PROS-U-1]